MERDTETYAIIGAAMAVHRELGHGFLEAVYHEALAIELTERGVPFLHEVELPIRYRGHLLRTHYRADFLCFEQIIVEIKALAALTNREDAQVLNYLKASGQPRGLLLNFGGRKLEYKRLIFTQRPAPPAEETP